MESNIYQDLKPGRTVTAPAPRTDQNALNQSPRVRELVERRDSLNGRHGGESLRRWKNKGTQEFEEELDVWLECVKEDVADGVDPNWRLEILESVEKEIQNAYENAPAWGAMAKGALEPKKGIAVSKLKECRAIVANPKAASDVVGERRARLREKNALLDLGELRKARTAKKEQSSRTELRTVHTKGSIYIGGTLLFATDQAKNRNDFLKSSEKNLDEPSVDAKFRPELEASRRDSEVATINAIYRGVKDRVESALLPKGRMTILIASTDGPCNGCKIRIHDLMTRLKTMLEAYRVVIELNVYYDGREKFQLTDRTVDGKKVDTRYGYDPEYPQSLEAEKNGRIEEVTTASQREKVWRFVKTYS